MNVLATPHLVKFYFVSFQTFLGTATKAKLHSFSTETTTTLRKVWFLISVWLRISLKMSWFMDLILLCFWVIL